jgi:hypothetical protein
MASRYSSQLKDLISTLKPASPSPPHKEMEESKTTGKKRDEKAKVKDVIK